MLARTILPAVVMVTLSLGFAASGRATDVTVDNPWARATPPTAPAGAVFMTLNNAGSSDDRLIKADADVSETVELHTHIRDGNVMRMREVEAVDVPAGGSTALKPGGFHIMLIDLEAPLTEGESFPLTLTFETAGEMTVEVPVKSAGAMGGGDHGMMDTKH